MVNSYLIQLLGKLSLAEFKEFGEYIRTPFFNKNESVIKLYDYIKIYYPDFSKMNFEKQYVYMKLFSNIEYDDAFMRKLMFKLAKLVEDYFVYKRNSNNENFSYSQSLLEEFLKRDLKKLYSKKLKSLKENLEEQKIKDSEYFKNKYLIDSYNTGMIRKEPVIINTKDKFDDHLITSNNSLINYFLIEILNEYRFLINYKKIVRFDFDFKFYELILNYLKLNEAAHNNFPLLSLYFNSLLLIVEEDESHFKNLKNLLIKEMTSFTWNDRYITFALLLNFANDEYTKGNKKYLKEAFELYKLILENRLYCGFEGGYFYNTLFKNIVNVGLNMKETEWTEKFIETYVNELAPDARTNNLHYSNARVNFVKGNYEQSLEDLSRITSVHHFHFKSSIKSLTLMIYIEKGWYDQAYSLIDTYRHYLSSDKLLPPVPKEKNVNFIKFCNEILKMKSKNTKEKINDTKFDLINTGNVLEKHWLMEKIEKLENSAYR